MENISLCVASPVCGALVLLDYNACSGAVSAGFLVDSGVILGEFWWISGAVSGGFNEKNTTKGKKRKGYVMLRNRREQLMNNNNNE